MSTAMKTGGNLVANTSKNIYQIPFFSTYFDRNSRRKLAKRTFIRTDIARDFILAQKQQIIRCIDTQQQESLGFFCIRIYVAVGCLVLELYLNHSEVGKYEFY